MVQHRRRVARDKSLRGNPTSRPVSSGMEAMVATLGAMSVAQPTEEVQRGDSAGNFVACDEEVYSGCAPLLTSTFVVQTLQ